MSGTATISRRSRITSAAGVVGELAASTITFVSSASAARSSMQPDSAAGTTNSLSSPHMADSSIGSAPSNPATVPAWATWSDRLDGSSPPGLQTAPPASLTAMTRMPADESRKASGPPTLPKPWITARLPTNGSSRAAKALRAHTRTPVDVAPAWPRVPPIDKGLPVTEPGSSSPRIMASVSMSHAMTLPSVLTSGAGMSLSGPSSGEISSVYRRVMRSSSWSERWVGSHRTPPLAPPKGRSATAVLNVMLAASAATSRASTSGWNRMPPLAGPLVVSWCTRQPLKTSTRPSSMRTGIETSSTRRGVRSMRWMSGSTPVSLAASSRRSSTAAHGSSLTLSPRRSRKRRRDTFPVVDEQLLDHRQQAGGRGALGQVDGDDVRVHVHRLDATVLEETPGQHRVGLVAARLGRRAVPLVAHTGQAAVELEAGDAWRRPRLLDDDDRLAHGKGEVSPWVRWPPMAAKPPTPP